jgi:hypothetical protein
VLSSHSLWPAGVHAACAEVVGEQDYLGRMAAARKAAAAARHLGEDALAAAITGEGECLLGQRGP